MHHGASYEQLLATASADEAVVGIVLVGSRVVAGFATERSDHDVYVILSRDDDRYAFVHGAAVETIPVTLDAFRTYALPGSGSEWDRPAFLNARVEIDKLNGEIGRLVARKARLEEDEARSLAAESLDAYINALYRSLRNGDAGRWTEGHLDAAESIPPLLTALFALERRVRPYNKWLMWELAAAPLPIDRVLERAEEILRTGDPAVQRGVFRDVEPIARARGISGIIDGWEPDLAYLRG
jgi:predicted nucleotidyltransferase